jgi:uncharacterized membrane protein YdjX (TVP38/TMEM64 family)
MEREEKGVTEDLPSDETLSQEKRKLRKVWLALAFLIVLAAAWRFSPLGDWLDAQTIAGFAVSLRQDPLAPFFVVAAYMVGGLVMFPIFVLIGATAAVFRPLVSITYALMGCLGSAVLLYGVGHKLGRDMVRRVAGGRLSRLSKRLAKRGLLAMVVIRVFPVAPYSIVNMVAGASHIQLRHFVAGTVLGMTPGVVIMTVLADRFKSFVGDPDLTNFAVLAAVALVAIAAGIWVRRRLNQAPARESTAVSNEDAV